MHEINEILPTLTAAQQRALLLPSAGRAYAQGFVHHNTMRALERRGLWVRGCGNTHRYYETRLGHEVTLALKNLRDNARGLGAFRA